jgi:hypothetical protein
MVYGSKVVLPAELEYAFPRVQALQDVTDLLKESMDVAIARSARYQQMLR